ncbi:TetR family transcriptional regulator [Spongiactinospora rosea]|uniref:TetR family transcriptional regulator n=1 Tax=Spongiactinospora rosea TaxID=2248750 RepID=A0A366LX58_9ACTN|nr:TetR/AcrR family transcriptional regulator [Spongiactinospora rosea]RBQ18548.1 TetR family transcriptional regulator [Spongiactinospora rosea]
METSSTPTRSRGRPAKMAAPEAVATALRLVDEEGLDALTMRRLATALGVQVGTLYRHFATKQDLLTAMAEEMLAGCADPPPDQDTWQEQVIELAGRLRAALLRRRDGARIYAGTHAAGPNTLAYAEALVGVLRGAGRSAESAARSTLAIVHFTLGHTLEEQAVGSAADGAAGGLYAALEPGRYPNLAAAAATLTSADYARHFAHGLDLLVRGLG